MVKYILLLFVFFCTVECLGQYVPNNKEVELSFHFSKDTFCFGDSVIINVFCTNKSNQNIIYYPIAFVQMIAYSPKCEKDTIIVFSDRYIKLPYILNSTLSKNDAVILNCGETYNISYSIKITDEHFFKGKNKVQITYWFKPNKQHRKKAGVTYNYLHSTVKNIFVE